MKFSLAVALMLSVPLMNSAAAQTEAQPAGPSASARDRDVPNVPPPTPAETNPPSKPATASDSSDRGDAAATEAQSSRPALGVRLPGGPVLDVIGVVEGSPADRAGIVTGDRIISMNGDQFASTNAFITAVGNAGLNQDVELVLDRHGKIIVVNPRLDSWDAVYGTSDTTVTALRPELDSGATPTTASSQPSGCGCGSGYPSYWTGYCGCAGCGYGGYGYSYYQPYWTTSYLYSPYSYSSFYAPYSGSAYYGYGPAYSYWPGMSWGYGWPIW
jgi:PDZ domain